MNYALRVKRRHLTQNGIDKLPDDLLITILSCISFKEAVSTSVLSRRWRYLWMYQGTLEFDDSMVPSNISQSKRRKKFKALLNHFLELHEGWGVHSIIISFTDLVLKTLGGCRDIDRWIYFALKNNVQRIELNLPVFDKFHLYYGYRFPYAYELLKVKSGYWPLRSLRLINVPIWDEPVQCLIASCPYLEDLCIRKSRLLNNLQVVDPSLPNLKFMDISECESIQSMEISSRNLVSFTSEGSNISLSPPLKKTPNLSELTLGGVPCESFVYEPNKHSHYSVQLVKLVLNFPLAVHNRPIVVPPDLPQLYSLKRLELNVESLTSRRLLFFTSLIKASPQLSEFKIKMDYKHVRDYYSMFKKMSFPEVTLADARSFYHKTLKVVEMAGYLGYPSADEFLVQLFKIASASLEMVFMDTQSNFWSARRLRSLYPTFGETEIQTYKDIERENALKCAYKLKSSWPSKTEFVIT